MSGTQTQMNAEQAFFNIVEDLESVSFNDGQLVLTDGVNFLYFNPQQN